MNIDYILPKILTSKSEDCSAYSIAACANWKFFNMGIAMEVDADKLYQETSPKKGEGQTLGAILTYCQGKGMPLMDGTRHRIKTFERILVSWAQAELALRKTPLVFSMKIPLGRSFDDSIHAPDYTLHEIFKTHSMVLCGSNNQKFKIANNKGTRWGLEGYGFIDYVLFNEHNVFDLYTFSI